VLQQPRRTFRDGAPGVELVATPTVASRGRTPVRKEDGVLMKNIAKRLKRYKSEREARRRMKRHFDYGVYFPLREDSQLLRRNTHTRTTNHKKFRIIENPVSKPFDYVVSEESCVLIHVPHGSEVLPALSAWGVREGVSVTDLSAEEQDREAKLLCDTGCLELVRELREEDLSRVSLFAARFSRMWLDTEHELVNTAGMGVIYERASDGKPLRESWTDNVRSEVLRYYRIYCKEFERAALAISARRGVCVVIDLHSYNKEPLPYEPRQDATRPELCVGTDDEATPPWLLELVLSSFDGVCETELNTPFSGAFTPSDSDLTVASVVSVMLEFRKDVLNDPTRAKEIRAAFCRLAETLNEHCRNNTNRQDIDLSYEDLSDVKLSNANLSNANLECANLECANLAGANLTGANLKRANLGGADLTDADLTDADLTDAFLCEADLTGANLTGANLSKAYLYEADLERANLAGAAMEDSHLDGTEYYEQRSGWSRWYNADRDDLDEEADGDI
jgi:N-formylglutamate deformylase